jgi:paraquat-inducible protein B
MSEALQDEPLDNLPESSIQPRSKFSIIWLVPLVAILIGAWIAYKAWSEMGPTITITFKTANGLEAGKTKIKYKNVEIGEVKTIRLNHGTKTVEVTAEMNRDAKPFLTEQTRFWVVRARIDVRGVSGLETLLSGAYIGVDPISKGKPTRKFTALDIPPVVTRNIPGKHFILHTQNLGSIQRDVPVYYRKFIVGQVEDVKLDDDGESITVGIFIRAPYDQWVNKTTKFWNASGIDFSMTASGINMNAESLVSILIGGITFESHDSGKDVSPAENNTEFKLYANRKDSLRIDSKIGIKYTINFSESVRGLSVGAPVEFRGMQLGEVTDIQLSLDTVKNKITVPVTIMIDFSKIAFGGNIAKAKQLYTAHEERSNYFVKQGMRAQLQTGNLITGQLYIGMDFFPDAPPFVIDWDTKIPEIPSIPGTFGAFKHDISNILHKADAMMTQVKELSYKLNHTVVPELSDTMKQAEKSLATIEDTLKNASPLQQDLQTALQELAKAARSIKNLTDYLQRHPESLIEGKKGN